jgi:hypothetical protein
MLPARLNPCDRALTLIRTGSLHTSGGPYAAAQQALRNLLVAPDKVWRKRAGRSAQMQVRIFQKADGTVLTLTADMQERLDAATAAV